MRWPRGTSDADIGEDLIAACDTFAQETAACRA